jgi:hypothetical protein
MKDIDIFVEHAFRVLPQTRESNDVLWVELSQALCEELGIETLEDFFAAIVSGDIPNSHSVAGSVCRVRKKYPELKPSSRSMKRKLEIRNEYIESYRNA